MNHRILTVQDVPVFLPAQSDPSFDYVAESIIQSLVPGNSFTCTELSDQSYSVQETIWSTLLSYAVYKRRTLGAGVVVNGATQPDAPFRIIYLCSGFHAVRNHFKLLRRLKDSLSVPDMDGIRMAGFSEPVDMCINKNVQGLYKKSNRERNAACRAAVRCGECPQYNNLYDEAVPKPDIPDFLTDLEDITVQLDKANVCPYYSMLSRMQSAQLIITTYEALKGTLSGQDTSKEKLILDKDTYLVCDDLFAMEKMFEECYDFAVSVPALQHVISFCMHRRHSLAKMQLARVPKLRRIQDFMSFANDFCHVLDKMCDVLKGEVTESPETPEGRLKLLVQIGLQKIDPKSTYNILTLLLTDLFYIRPRNLPKILLDIINVQQFFLNLANPDIACWLFSTVENQPFRFWADQEDNRLDEAPGLSIGNFQFFGVSVNPVLLALRKRGINALLGFGTMLPVSFATIDPQVTFRTRRLVNDAEVQMAPSSRPLFSGIFAFGPGDVSFNCTPQQREHSRYIRALGQTIREVVDVVPDKVLILFPSKSYHDSCSAVWKTDETLRELGDSLQPLSSCNCTTCSFCSGNMDFRQKNGFSVMTFARGAAIDGTCGGYQAIVIVSFPYRFFGDSRTKAKKAYLGVTNRFAAFDSYGQETVNAIAAPFIRMTCLDPLSPRRGRIFIVLDSRLQRAVNFLPQAVQQSLVEYTTFNQAMASLKKFLHGIPAWDISGGTGEFLDPTVQFHLRQLPEVIVLLAAEKNRTQLLAQLSDLVEQYRDDENMDLFAARLLHDIQLEQLFQSPSFLKEVLPWFFNFRHYFRTSILQAYWVLVMKNLLKQLSEKFFATDATRVGYTVSSNSQLAYKRCHVQ